MKTNRQHLPRPSCLLLLPCLILTLPPAIRAAELTTPDGVADVFHSGARGLSGNAGLVGNSYGAGKAYFFRDLDTVTAASVILTASDPANSDFFGGTAALSGNNGLVGAPGQDAATGAVYLFRSLDTAPGTVTENAKLTASDGAYEDRFGASVSLSGNAGLVGAFEKGGNQGVEDESRGAVYLFRSLDTASGTVTENAKLAASDGARRDNFGVSVSLSGNAGLVGAYGKDINKGAVYLFRSLDTASGTVTENARLAASDGAKYDMFGGSVSLSGNAGIVGAIGKDGYTGAAYLFRSLDTASGTVTENAKLTASDSGAGAFGQGVSLSGDVGLVGARAKGNSKGAAYLFRNLGAASGTVTENVQLTASDGVANDHFGAITTLDGDRFLISTDSRAYSGRVSAFTTLDEGGASRSTDRLSLVSQDNWVIGQNTDGNQLTLSAGDSGTVAAAGRKVTVGQNAGSDNNILTVNGSLTANTVLIGAAGNTGNSLRVGVGGIVTTTGGVIVAVGSSVGGDGTINGNLEFSAASSLIFSPNETLTVNGSVLFDGSFGVTNLIGLDQSTPDRTYTLIDGTTTNFAASGLSNWGEANAYDLGGGKKAWFEQGSLKLVVVPESGTGLLALLAGTALILNRRPSRRR